MDDLVMRKLEMIANGQEGEPITRPGEHPPCFESTSEYQAWLDACDFADKTGVSLPVRVRWPGEPNYCYECSRGHRNSMRSSGRCLFPGTIFVIEGEGEDAEEVGIEP